MIASRCSSVRQERPTCHTAGAERTMTYPVPVNITARSRPPASSATRTRRTRRHAHTEHCAARHRGLRQVAWVRASDRGRSGHPPRGSTTARWNCAKVLDRRLDFTTAERPCPRMGAGFQAMQGGDLPLICIGPLRTPGRQSCYLRERSRRIMPTMSAALSTKRSAGCRQTAEHDRDLLRCAQRIKTRDAP